MLPRDPADHPGARADLAYVGTQIIPICAGPDGDPIPANPKVRISVSPVQRCIAGSRPAEPGPAYV